MRSSLRCAAAVFAIATLALMTVSGCTGDDANKAKLRVLNTSLDYDSVDLYVDGERKLAAVANATASGYLALDADTYTIAFARNGSSSKLESSSATLDKGSHKTYVTYGRTGSFGVLGIDEDQGEAASGKAKLLVLNTATDAGAVDVYLTGSSDELGDSSPIVSDLATGAAASGYVTVSSGSYRLRITAAGSISDVRLDVSTFSLSSKAVASLIVSGTTGGVLVNAILLPQQGSLVLKNNTQARVRAAVGVSNSAAVTASMGSVNLVTGAASDTIGAYKLVDASTDIVDLTADSNDITVADQVLTAGGDYTFLVWDNSAGTQTTLISDDNRLPLANGGVKLRLINAMSGLTDPISVLVDFSPVAESVATGQASSFTELTSSTDSRLDVTNASTTTTLFTQTGTSLLDQGVYTLFMFGDASDTTGRLRKDR